HLYFQYMIIQFCGLSGSGKSTLANAAKARLESVMEIEVIDGDVYRKTLCADLGFSRADREINIRRLAKLASEFAAEGKIPIICAINPYDSIRREITGQYPDVHTIFIQCGLEELFRRDTKGLYRKTQHPPEHPERVNNLSGVNDPFEAPADAALVINTDRESIEESAAKLVAFILLNVGAKV
ncbi:MAG TPA: adenylyl-sulfate kinase, partial [Chitinophagaceae bacterium]